MADANVGAADKDGARMALTTTPWRALGALFGTYAPLQCREKWRNDLRPDISKEPWTLQEEYVLAR